MSEEISIISPNIEEVETAEVIQEDSQPQVVLEFDLKKLSKDIAEITEKEFEGQLVTAKAELKGSTVAFFQLEKARIIADLDRPVQVVHFSDTSQVKVERLDHPEFTNVLCSIKTQSKAMLVGPAGTGKTTMIEQMAERLKVPFQKYSCSRDSSVHDLIGYKQPASETYLNTTFLDIYENGGIFLVDEYDAMPGDMALFFNGVADNSKFISLPHRDSNPKAMKHKDFMLVLCGNTYGKGSVDYSGRDFQDLALLDRFRLCKHFIGYNENLEKKLTRDKYPYYMKVRKAFEDKNSYISTRNIQDCMQLESVGYNQQYILKMLTQDLSPVLQKSLIDTITIGSSQASRNNGYF